MEGNTDKLHVRQLVDLCRQNGVEHVVISPGSRSTPLIIAFNRTEGIKTHVVVDERSAGYFALGIAQRTQQVVAVVCTSGTALLNYAPAVAEAFYQQIPLLVISADRPLAWIDQDDSQTIRQQNVFQHSSKAFYQLQEHEGDEESYWYNNRQINEAFIKLTSGRRGPVQINVPLKEPLSNVDFTPVKEERLIRHYERDERLSDSDMSHLANVIGGTEKVLIVASMFSPNSKMLSSLKRLALLPNVVVLTESVSNLTDGSFVNYIDRTLSRMDKEERDSLKPEVVISFGGAIISRQLKQWLRDSNLKEHWHIGKGDDVIDTYKQITNHIDIEPSSFIESLASCMTEMSRSEYRSRWNALKVKSDCLHREYLATIGWSDMKAFECIMNCLPEKSIVHLSNGTSVRYHQLFERSSSVEVYSNRGTSGIDGSTSTAVGAASVSDRLTTFVTGDISFLYDSNGLWNERFPKNIRIIIINNNGGGIFRYIPGPTTLNECERFFETPHSVDIKSLSDAYGLDYLRACSEAELNEALRVLYSGDRPCILDVQTPRELNDEILRDYFKYKSK